MKLLTIGEAAETAGITVKRLRYWDKAGLVRPRRVGVERRYGSEELAQVEQAKIYTSRGLRPKDVVQLFERRPARSKYLGQSVDANKELEARLSIDAGYGPIEIPVPDFATYNSTFKRVRRLLKKLGRNATITKRGTKLTVVLTD